MSSHEGRARVRAALRRHWPMLALSVLVVAAAVGLHRTGHAWGDDFTLYLRQGQSLLDGNIGQVVADNHFNVDNSARPGFSPYVYPWGFPMLMAPFLRMFGLDFAKLKLVEVACFVVFLWGFHAVVRRRMHRWLAFATVASVGTTLAYLVHTDKLVSEFPYMAGVGLTLWWLDRLRHEQPLDAASRGQLVTLGLMAMCVFNVRREGLALIAAIAVAQLLDLRGRWRAADRRQVATPFVTFLGSAVLAQLLLPSAIAPEYADAGLHQTWSKLQGPFRTAFADQLGFSWLAGVRLLLVSLVVVAGVAIRLWRRPATDAPLVVFAVGSMLLVGMIPAIADRYLLGVTPFAVYFAAQAVAAIPLPRQLASRQAGAWLATATLLWSIAGVVTRHLDAARSFEVTFWRSLFNTLTLLVVLLPLRGTALFRDILAVYGAGDVHHRVGEERARHHDSREARSILFHAVSLRRERSLRPRTNGGHHVHPHLSPQPARHPLPHRLRHVQQAVEP